MKILFAILLVFTSCSTASRMNRVSIGMSKSEVIDQLGDPASTKGANGVEILEYHLRTDLGAPTHPYWVYLTSGKVSSYGKAGDFGTSAPSTQKIILEHH